MYSKIRTLQLHILSIIILEAQGVCFTSNATRVSSNEAHLASIGRLSAVNNCVTSGNNSNCSNLTERQYSRYESDVFKRHLNQRYFVTGIYSGILVTGVPGNMMLILAMFSMSRGKAVKNYFLVNLALGDLINLLVSIPLSITGLYMPWPFGSIICKFVFPLVDVSIANNIFTMLALSVERYQAIVQIKRQSFKGRTVALISLLTWFLSYICVGLPLTLALRVKNGHWVEKSCGLTWLSRFHEVAYRVGVFFLLFCVPFSMIGTCLFVIRSHLLKNNKFAAESMNPTATQTRMLQNMRIIRMLGVVVACFVVCVLPLNILLIAMCFYQPILSWPQLGLVVQIFFTLLLCHSTANPVIMFIFSKEIRGSILKNFNRIVCHSLRIDRKIEEKDESLSILRPPSSTTTIGNTSQRYAITKPSLSAS